MYYHTSCPLKLVTKDAIEPFGFIFWNRKELWVINHIQVTNNISHIWCLNGLKDFISAQIKQQPTTQVVLCTFLDSLTTLHLTINFGCAFTMGTLGSRKEIVRDTGNYVHQVFVCVTLKMYRLSLPLARIRVFFFFLGKGSDALKSFLSLCGKRRSTWMQVFKIKSWKLHYKIELNGKREGEKDQANLKAFILFFYKSFKVLTKKWFKDGNTTNVDH